MNNKLKLFLMFALSISLTGCEDNSMVFDSEMYESEQEITKAIENLSKDKTIFVIAHRLSTIKNADKIAVIGHGKIVGFGTDKELEAECEIYQKLKLGAIH